MKPFSEYLKHFKAVFQRPRGALTKGDLLLQLEQGSRSTAHYALEFRTLAVHSGWSHAALVAWFRNGLTPCLQQELASLELDELAIRLDQLSGRLTPTRPRGAGGPVAGGEGPTRAVTPSHVTFPSHAMFPSHAPYPSHATFQSHFIQPAATSVMGPLDSEPMEVGVCHLTSTSTHEGQRPLVYAHGPYPGGCAPCLSSSHGGARGPGSSHSGTQHLGSSHGGPAHLCSSHDGPACLCSCPDGPAAPVSRSGQALVPATAPRRLAPRSACDSRAPGRGHPG
ncbi:uncharacterized protein [Salminus brasiliensis]|uniref:uncharacterized protein isoform X2 n=1 Tax=Salminus brasiliensis TaxID=930266 RepID=UPI003B835B08